MYAYIIKKNKEADCIVPVYKKVSCNSDSVYNKYDDVMIMMTMMMIMQQHSEEYCVFIHT